MVKGYRRPLDDIQRRISAVTSPIRREILWRVWDHELAAGAIADAFDLTAPTISAHLRVLRESGLVVERRFGTFRYYRADRDSLRALRPLLDPGADRWEPANDLPERAVTSTSSQIAVVVVTTLPVPAAGAFAALTDPEVFSRWLGVPVSLDGGVFAAQMEWGTTVRGRYEHLVDPGSSTSPGTSLTWVRPHLGASCLRTCTSKTAPRARSRVEARQLVDDASQVVFMEAAWGVVLGRLHDGARAAFAGRAAPRRRPRPKQRATPRSGP